MGSVVIQLSAGECTQSAERLKECQVSLQ